MKQGWTYKKLGDICEVTDFVANGSFATLKQNVTYYDEPNFAILVRLADYSSNFDSSKFVYVDEHAYNFLAKSKLYGGEVIMSNVGSIGKCFLCPILDKPMTIGPNSLLIRTPNNRFYLYYFRSETFIKDLHSITSSATLSKFNKTQLKTLSVPVPSDTEQERIVERLNAAFAQIDELKSNAEKQLAEARALFQSALTQAMQPKPGWQEKKFGDVCFYHKEQAIHRNSKFIGMEHIESGTGVLLGYQNSNEIESASFSFTKGDVLYGRLRPYLRKVIIAEFDGCCSTEIFPIRSNNVEPEFIKYWFLSDYITNKINATSAGCRMPRGNMNEVKHFPFAFPKEKSEQKRVANNIDLLSNHIIELEEICRKTAAECDAMKQALLRQIFE